eukprot:COSAG06_NODE_1233_length_10152_cov_11.443251_10_plen_100_part_00
MLRLLRLLRLFGGGLSQRLLEVVLGLDPHIGTIEIEVNVRHRCGGHPATDHVANVAFGLVRTLPPIGVDGVVILDRAAVNESSCRGNSSNSLSAFWDHA